MVDGPEGIISSTAGRFSDFADRSRAAVVVLSYSTSYSPKLMLIWPSVFRT